MTLEPLSPGQRKTVLAAAFLGWMFAGMEMSLLPMAARAAIIDFLGRPAVVPEGVVGRWFSWYIAAFLLGAAAGGLLFGWIADRYGRVRSMGWSILCYSLLTALSYFVSSAEQLLVLRFAACLGIGGMWPAGVSLTSEAWPEASKPTVSGALGASANLGIFLMGLAGQAFKVHPESWRWVLLAGGAPAILGIAVLARLPESPLWLAGRGTARSAPLGAVLRPPLLRNTLLGIALGTIPLFGAWGSSKWLLPWADQVRGESALTQTLWAGGATLGSLSGGWLSNALGPRRSYFLISLGSFLAAGGIYRLLVPGHPLFLPAVLILGVISTSFFGWLPHFLPQLFPVSSRATGMGISYNFGRIATAAGVLGAGVLMQHLGGSYARVGAIISLVYVAGMVVICLVPKDPAKALASDSR